MAKESKESLEERAKSSTSPEELEKLAEDADAEVRGAVAYNPNTPASALEKLAADEDEYARRSVAYNPNTPASLLEKLAADEGEDVRKAAAGNPNTPASLLEKLAADEYEYARGAVAGNPNTPASLLEKLAGDEDEDVRGGVAGNTSTPASVLEKLAEDKSADVRGGNIYSTGGVAGNTSTPASLLEKLAEDKNEDVRKGVARNTSTPVSVLEKLAGDENEDVRKAVAENENTPTSVLEKKTAIDDKAKALLVESLKKTAEKIEKWISDSGTTLALGESVYTVWEKERENGTFTVKKNGKSEEIEGYMMWENKSSIILKWWLPDSASAAIETLEKDEWSDRDIEYDDNEWSGSSEGKSSVAFDENDNSIEDSDNFEGDGDTEVVDFGSIHGPSSLTITYENDQEVVFKSSGDGSWTVKIAGGQPESIPDYEAVLVLVRTLLN